MVYSLTILKGDSNMSLSRKEIMGALSKANFWLSRNLGDKENPKWTNPNISEAKEGDTVWFSSKATTEDMQEVQKLLTKASLHLYSKDLAEGKEIRRTQKGSYSFIALPNGSTS